MEWSGLGLGLANSSSDSRLKSWRSLWGKVIGLDPGDEGREDERGRFLGGGVGLVTASWGLRLVTAKTACCNSFAHFQRSVSGSAGGRLEVA